MSSVDVLIIGGGPVGLFTAFNLVRQGVSVRIIDKLMEPAPGGRADGLHCRTIEIMNGVGLASELIEIGFVNYDMVTFVNGVQSTRTKMIDGGQDESEFDYALLIGQQHIERVIIEALAKLGVEVERPVTVEDLEVADDSVTVVLKNLKNGVLETVKASYAIGCDGAHSWVRKRLGFAFEGQTSAIGWGVIEGIIETNFKDPQLSDNGSVFFVPREDDITRMYVRLSGDMSKREERQKVSLETILEEMERNFSPFTFKPKEVTWWTNYVVGQHVAESFSYQDRVFLAGDASHSHSPTVGQGLNTGLNDAFNLAWKLSLVLRNIAQPVLLSTYQLERKSIAEQVINIDHKVAYYSSGKTPHNTSPGYSSSYDKEYFYVWKKNVGFSTGLGVEYDPNLITVRDAGGDGITLDAFETELGVLAGQRAPDGPVIFGEEKGRLHRHMPLSEIFYVLVLAGDVAVTRTRLEALDLHLETEDGFTRRFGFLGKNGQEKLFKFLIIGDVKDTAQVDFLKGLQVTKEGGKVLVDDDGKVHKRYGVDVTKGALVVVRPDSWIGACVDLENFMALEQYFQRFLVSV